MEEAKYGLFALEGNDLKKLRYPIISLEAADREAAKLAKETGKKVVMMRFEWIYETEIVVNKTKEEGFL
jgi:hypothetical protein